MDESYKHSLINFSTKELSENGFLSLFKGSVFPDPVYLCRSVPPFNREFDNIKDYVITKTTLVNEDSIKEVLGFRIIPIIFISDNDEITALIANSDEQMSIIINKEDLTQVLDDLNNRIRFRRRA